MSARLPLGMAEERVGLSGMRGFGSRLPFVHRNVREDSGKTERQIEFRDALLDIMDEKDSHWSRTAFAGLVPKERLNNQFFPEYAVFVKNFPDYLENALHRGPVPRKVRKDLEANIKEERYGKGARKILERLKRRGVISYVPENTSHPELFKLIPKGLGLHTDDYDSAELPPKAQAFRDFLIDASGNRGWAVSVAIGTIFLEGKHERDAFAEDFPGHVTHVRSEHMTQHPLAVYDAGPDDLMLTLVHHEFEGAGGDHRLSAWNMVLEHIPESERANVLGNMNEALRHYNEWRDEIAEACGIEKGEDGSPRLKV